MSTLLIAISSSVAFMLVLVFMSRKYLFKTPGIKQVSEHIMRRDSPNEYVEKLYSEGRISELDARELRRLRSVIHFHMFYVTEVSNNNYSTEDFPGHITQEDKGLVIEEAIKNNIPPSFIELGMFFNEHPMIKRKRNLKYKGEMVIDRINAKLYEELTQKASDVFRYKPNINIESNLLSTISDYVLNHTFDKIDHPDYTDLASQAIRRQEVYSSVCEDIELTGKKRGFISETFKAVENE